MFTYINPDVRRKLIERKKLVRIDDDVLVRHQVRSSNRKRRLPSVL